jgi:hypothetical protein
MAASLPAQAALVNPKHVTVPLHNYPFTHNRAVPARASDLEGGEEGEGEDAGEDAGEEGRKQLRVGSPSAMMGWMLTGDKARREGGREGGRVEGREGGRVGKHMCSVSSARDACGQKGCPI